MKHFIKLNVKTDMIVKSAKRMKLDTKILSAILNTKTLKMI